jgi:hydroperoxide dehydratase
MPMQYDCAKQDMVVESHDNGYEVREWELLFGFQLMATPDPHVFVRSESDEYVPDRLLRDDDDRLLSPIV